VLAFLVEERDVVREAAWQLSQFHLYLMLLLIGANFEITSLGALQQ
jgi:hypothetical protein